MKTFVVFIFVLQVGLWASPSGNAIFFDGGNDYLALFEPAINTKYYTIEAWFKTMGVGGGAYTENTIFEQRSSETGSGATAVVLLPKNAYEEQCSFEVRDNLADRIKVFSTIPSHLQWHHLAGVVGPNEILLYIDGAIADRSPNSHQGNYFDGIDHTDIGRHFYQDIVAGYFNGYIDDLRIWNYARSSEEINNWMYATIDQNDPEVAAKLLAYWDFNDFYEFYKNHTQYVGVKDLSGNEHHGAFIDNATLKAVEHPILVLEPFSLLNPADGTQLQQTSVGLEWQSATPQTSGPKVYQIFIDEDAVFTTPLVFSTPGLATFWKVNDLVPGTTYFWKVLAQQLSGQARWSSEVFSFTIDSSVKVKEDPSLPSNWTLLDNYPNPFNLQTTIVFDVGQVSFIRITVLDLQGNVVRTLTESFMNAGLHQTTWDGRNASGAAVSSGLYFCRLEGRTSGSVAGCLQKKMTLVK